LDINPEYSRSRSANAASSLQKGVVEITHGIFVPFQMPWNMQA
jgi:hypothetical protein